jgi:hypothetical protein
MKHTKRHNAASCVLALFALALLGLALKGCGTETPCDSHSAYATEQCNAVGEPR